MATINISLPEPMRTFLEEETVRSGHASVSEYVRALVREAQERRAQEQLEQKLLDGLASPRRALTKEDWKRLERRIQERAANRRP